MKVAMGADHAGFALKDQMAVFVKQLGHETMDLGTYTSDPVDYPDVAAAVAEAVRTGQAERGILFCGSGVGTCVAANKVRGVRAAVCHDTYSAHQAVEHDALNVLCLGSRVIGSELAMELIRAFLAARFTQEERHVRRLSKVNRLEETGR